MVNHVGINGSKAAEGLLALQRQSCYMNTNTLSTSSFTHTCTKLIEITLNGNDYNINNNSNLINQLVINLMFYQLLDNAVL